MAIKIYIYIIYKKYKKYSKKNSCFGEVWGWDHSGSDKNWKPLKALQAMPLY